MTPEKPDFSGDSIWWLDRDGLLDFIDDLGNGDLYPGSTPFFDYLQGLDVPATLEEHIDFLTSNGGFVDRWRGEDIESTFSDSGIVIETATEATTIATVSATSYSLGASVVPIPAAAWLFGSALMGLGWMRRKRLG